jgi:uncharacterized protein YwqG
MRQKLSKGAQPLAFLGQVALEEIHAVAPLPGWPNSGTLAFFYDLETWGYDPLSRGHCRVLYFPPDEDLVPTPPPQALPAEARFPQRRMVFMREWTLPTYLEQDGVDLSRLRNDDYGDLCHQLTLTLDGDETTHRCGGHPQEIQGDMRLECQLVTHGLYCGDSRGYQDPRRSSLEKGAADWQLLLQVDSDEERLGWMWGDTGRVYFWARRQDIQAADFDGAWAVLQCY